MCVCEALDPLWKTVYERTTDYVFVPFIHGHAKGTADRLEASQASAKKHVELRSLDTLLHVQFCDM